MKKYLFVLLFLCAAYMGFAAERITDFSVRMRVNTDASVNVTETISVVAEHKQIKRGIYRDFPHTQRTALHDISLEMDGSTHPFFTEKVGNSTRINFGDNTYLLQGKHTYHLSYTVDNVVRPFRKYDEIYWNVTGERWAFPIEQASFRLELPEGAEPILEGISSYVGKSGTKGVPAQRRGLFFETQNTLNPGNGFTVAVPWQKGIIHFDHSATYLLLIKLLAGFLLLCAYYWWAWNRVGRDPKAHVYTRYEPPQGISPAQTAYIYSMGMGESPLLSTSIISIAMKGLLEIKENTSFWSGRQVELIKPFNKLKSTSLFADETVTKSALFGLGNKIVIGSSSSSAEALRKASQKLTESLKTASKEYFSNNFSYNLPTFLYMIFSSVLLAHETFLLLLFIQIVVIAGTYSLLAQKHKKWVWKILFLGILLVLPHLILSSFMEVSTVNSWNFGWTLLVVIAPTIGGMFAQWIKSYTVQGRELMDQIEGFKHYLEVGEKGRIEASNPTDALRVFCDYLPYAYALGVEGDWMKQFRKVFSTQQLKTAMHARGLATTHLHSLARSISASTSSGGHSSGSFGGGHVGGGFGGGGGGGR